MNALYVNIKVDREERPDLDKLYQLAHQLLSRRGGGWPLTVFLEPDSLAPFFAGTYFPPAPRHGMPAFTELLQRVRDWFDENRDEVHRVKDQLAEAIATVQAPGEVETPDVNAVLTQAARYALERQDRLHGGFGGAPKFPQAPLLASLPVLTEHDEDLLAARPLEHALLHMSRGGLRDHLDGGFYRYTVDGDWTIPHFEKMLYDNAQLLPLFAAFTENPWCVQVAEGIVDWLTRELGPAEHGFAASIDADAAGVEGGFHVWGLDELRALLEPAELAAARQAFGLDQPPNFEGSHWHLTRRDADGGADAQLTSAVARMRERRSTRTPPATDHKRLTAWNALCVSGLVRAGLALDRPEWIDDANAAMSFIRSRAWREGALYAVVADGEARFPAYLDDHAFTLQAALDLLEARWDGDLYAFARTLADRLLDEFEDREAGGFCFTAVSADMPVQRLRVLQDDATPNGNGAAALALLQLGHLAAEPRYLAAVDRLVARIGEELERYPLAHATLLRVLAAWHRPPAQVIIAGADPDVSTRWAQSLRGRAHVTCYAVGEGSAPLPAAVPEDAVTGATRAWVCRGLHCLPPVDTIGALEKELDMPD
jgi:uncharacterized protein YyaL (SSP411 family)